jgi:RNA polymerase sigma-70 factor (ECF subfamily)
MNDTATTSDQTFDAWAQLRDGVHRFIARRISDVHAADDVTQEVMLKVRSGLPASGQIERLDAWVMAIARNAVIDHYRARRDTKPLDTAAEVAAEDDDVAPTAELSSCVRKLIDKLAPADAEALRLVDLEGLSQQALADRLGLSLSGAKSRVQRARGKLAEMIMDCCDLERNRRGGVIDYQTTPRTARYCGDPPGPCSS